MTDAEIRLMLSIAAGVMVVFGVAAIIGFKSRPRKTARTVFSAVSLLIALMGGMMFAVGSFTANSASAKSERYFILDPAVKRALSARAIDKRLPADKAALKSPWALVTVEVDKDSNILKTDYAACSFGKFGSAGDAAALKTIVFAYAYPYDTVSYAVQSNGKNTGRTVKVDREAGTLYFYDLAEQRFTARYDTGPASVPASYDGAGKPSGGMTADDFEQVILTVLRGNGQ
jgi:hypothetical protein